MAGQNARFVGKCEQERETYSVKLPRTVENLATLLLFKWLYKSVRGWARYAVGTSRNHWAEDSELYWAPKSRSVHRRVCHMQAHPVQDGRIFIHKMAGSDYGPTFTHIQWPHVGVNAIATTWSWMDAASFFTWDTLGDHKIGERLFRSSRILV